MQYRQSVLLASKALTADHVEIIDLLGNDPISRITVLYKGTNNGSTPTAHPAKLVTKIEIIDGSEVIASLSGIQCQALEYWTNKRVPFGIFSWWDNQNVIAAMNIDFGLSLYDEMFALDPKKFKNPQLRITVDLNGGGSACDAGVLEVIAHMFDKKQINPVGFLMSKEFYNYSMVSSAWETIDLPNDHAIRAIMLQSLASGKQPYEQYNEVIISENNDKSVPINNNVSDLIKSVITDYPIYIEGHEFTTTTSEVSHYCTPTYEEDIACSSLGATVETITAIKSRGGVFGVKGGSGSLYGQAVVKGYCPHGSLLLPICDLMKIDTFPQVNKDEMTRLKIKGGSSVGSSSTLQVVTQQLRRY